MMQHQVESSEQAEALVNTLQIEGVSLTDANLSGLSSSDLEQLASLQAELESIEASEIETEVEHVDVKPMLHGDIVETEIGEQEVEIEADDDDLDPPSSPDEILPDYKEHSEVIKFEASGAPPPLRPLTIAPKPVGKLPMALKTAAVVNAGSGQQIVLIQSPGGTTNTVNLGGQHIKLVSAQGTPVSLPNLQNVQLASKSGGVVQLRAVSKSQVQQDTACGQVKTIQGGVKKIIPQNKNILTKVIMGGGTNQLLLDSPQLKLVSTSSNLLPTTTRFTVAQAQQMGLLTSSLQRVAPGAKQTLLVNKSLSVVSVPQSQPGINAVKLAPTKQVKSPHKILPAPLQLQKVQTKEGLQRVIIKQGGQLKTGVVTSGGSGVNQVIRLPSGQTLNTSSSSQIHQIQVPGKGVQYIRFMTTSSTSASTVTATTATMASGSAGTSLTPSASAVQLKTSQGQKAQVVPVAGITVNRGKITSGTLQNIIKVVPLSSSQTRPVAPKPNMSGQRLLIPATSAQSRPAQSITTIPAAALSQLQGTIIPSGNNVSQIVMLPAQYVQQIQNQTNSTPKITNKPMQKTLKISPQTKDLSSTSLSTSTTVSNSANVSLSASVAEISSSPESAYSRTLEPNGIRPRKPCNCTKSLCLKLYCDCFANGEFCHLCNCMNCYNNLEKEEERQRAIKNCLERNPNAFRPKIGKGKEAGESSVRKHTKGCNCKRSGCLKNYCECYEAKIACSSNCKCIGCRNIEDSMEKKNVRPLAPMPDLQVVPTAKNKQPPQDVASFRAMISNANKLPSTYMTSEVIEATNQCMIAQADEAERNMMSKEEAVKMILEEFGRCLVQIIECSNQAIANT